MSSVTRSPNNLLTNRTPKWDHIKCYRSYFLQQQQTSLTYCYVLILTYINSSRSYGFMTETEFLREEAMFAQSLRLHCENITKHTQIKGYSVQASSTHDQKRLLLLEFFAHGKLYSKQSSQCWNNHPPPCWSSFSTNYQINGATISKLSDWSSSCKNIK